MAFKYRKACAFIFKFMPDFGRLSPSQHNSGILKKL